MIRAKTRTGERGKDKGKDRQGKSNHKKRPHQRTRAIALYTSPSKIHLGPKVFFWAQRALPRGWTVAPLTVTFKALGPK